MICSKSKCTGCFACYNICPKNAIKMQKDEYGNVYPEIDLEKCVNCKLCERVCPQSKENVGLVMPMKAFAMHLKDAKLRSESTSGGAATALYENILEEKGVVYGASNLFGEEEFKFIRIDSKDDLYKIKGSKYVHCYINDTFKSVKEDLINNKKVLFIATPCQISGLKSFLMREYDNLITADIVCHGVPSQKLFFDELNARKINHDAVYYVLFRDEKGYNLKLIDQKKNILFESGANDVPFYDNFLKGNVYRENCYSCRYATRERIADITLGDFWGLDKNSSVFDDESRGISLILVNTKKGENLVNKIIDKSQIEERTIEEAVKGNMQLNHPMKKTIEYEKYVRLYPKVGYKRTMGNIKTFREKIKDILKKNKIIFKTYKSLKR